MSAPDDFDTLFGGESLPDPFEDTGPEPEAAPGGANPFAAEPEDPFAGPATGGEEVPVSKLDLDLAFSLSVLHAGRAALREAVARGVTPERLKGDGKRIYGFALEHLTQYGQVPTPDEVLARLALAVPPFPPDGAPAFWTTEVLYRDLHSGLHERLERWTSSLEQRRPQDAFADIREWVRETSLSYAPVTVESANVHVARVKQRFLDRKAGKMGIQTPWPTINRLTYGIYSEQVWLFVARSGVGKTFAALALALHAWAQGERVLFATTEMSQVEVVQRMVAMELKLPYSAFNAGKLHHEAEQRFLTRVDDLFNDGNFCLVGGDFDFEPSSYESAIEKMNPTLTILDGAYLLKGKGKSRVEQAANASEELKRIGKRQKVAQVITSQFNREAKAEDAKSGAQEKVALADALVWLATVIYAFAQTKDMRRDRIMQGRFLKNREGPQGDPMTFNWDMEAMDFTEKAEESEAADFDTGITGPAPAPLDPLQADVPF